MTVRATDLSALLAKIKGGLVVSCQAQPDEPLFGAATMVKMAHAALEGGAVGIRANTPVDVAAIRQVLPEVPLIGLYKYDLPDYEVRITPTVATALELAEAGCDVIALDATLRPRPEGGDLAGFIRMVKEATGLPILADISTVEEGLAAEAAGVELLSTTLSGYTNYSPQQEEPDLALVAELVGKVKIPVLAEGRIATPAQAHAALEAGAYAVVVGGAITRPQWIARQFVKAL